MEKGFRSLRAFAVKVGITERQLFRILKDAEPVSYEATVEAIAVALGCDRATFDREWRSTPVAPPRAKAKGPRFVRFELSGADMARLKDFADRRSLSIADAAKSLVVSGLPADIPDLVINHRSKRRREPSASPTK